MSAVDGDFGSTAGQDHHPLDVVAQLADVARPDMRLQHRHRVLADLTLRQTGGERNLIHEVLDQFGNVLAPL